MKIKYLITCFVLSFSPLTYGQTPNKQTANVCALTVEQSPEVRGLKLGQDYEVLRSLSSKGLQYRNRGADDIGITRLYLTPILDRDMEMMKGVGHIELIYLDGKLSSFEIDYDSDVMWHSDAHFAAAIAEQLKLPTSGWVDKYGTASLQCAGFVVEAEAFSNGKLKIETSNLQQEITKRRAERDQKKRVEFKP
jgi:hypothetical protein